MTTRLRLLIFLFAGVVLTTAGVWMAVGAAQESLERDERSAASAQRMLRALVRQEAAVEAHLHSGDLSARRAFDAAGAEFDGAVAEAIAAAPDAGGHREQLMAQVALARRWRELTVTSFSDVGGASRGFATRRAALFEELIAAGETLQAGQATARAGAAADARRRIAIFVAPVGLLLGGLLLWLLTRHHADRRRYREERRHREHQEEFTRALQASRSEREAQRLLKRQLERSIDGSSATVFNRNNSANRLEAVTSIRHDSPLADAVPDAEPEDCIAVRVGDRYERAAGATPLLACELCGGVPESVTCVPSLVGGEVIGSVLVEHQRPLEENDRHRMAEAVVQAAPVLANMRNLRLAESRAATDALTGLPNRRSAEETLKRMLAHAHRSKTQCAVALFDLDHFKRVNDMYGHDKGDQLLAGVGDAVPTTLRASDFVARFGGEEFLVVLPDTDLDAAVGVCDKLREAISGVSVSGLPQRATASFGIAVFPADGPDQETLLRGADRALYDAKGCGRNCVKTLRDMAAEPVAAADAEHLY